MGINLTLSNSVIFPLELQVSKSRLRMCVSFIYDRTRNILNNHKFHDVISLGREKGGTKQKQKYNE